MFSTAPVITRLNRLCRLPGYSIIVLIMEAVRTSETSVYSSETTRGYIPETLHFNYIRIQSSNLAGAISTRHIETRSG
jgi:hypothetical protein